MARLGKTHVWLHPGPRRIRRLVCALLCLATWRGPLPWVHEHTANLANADSQVSRHLKLFHEGARPGEPSGWHIHFVLLGQMLPEENDERPCGQNRDPLLAFGVLVSMDNVDSHAAAHLKDLGCRRLDQHTRGLAPNGASSLARADNAKPRPPSFLTSLLEQRPLRALTGLALC